MLLENASEIVVIATGTHLQAADFMGLDQTTFKWSFIHVLAYPVGVRPCAL